MDRKSWAARNALKEATRARYDKLVDEAKLTPLQEEMLRLHIALGEPIREVALITHCSEATVKRHLHNAYRRVALLLN